MKLYFFGILVFAFTQIISGSSARAQDLALDWKAEPEFGGFYEAYFTHLYEKSGLKTQILPGGAGQPVAQMVAAKKAVFGIAAADEVILARAQGSKIVAIYAVYQDDPQGFMTHAERNIESLRQLFQSKGTIAMQKGLPYTLWIQKQYAPIQANEVPYTGGITSFIKDPEFSQQCFVTSEPLAAKREKQNPKTFLISESGFNPYLTVVIVHEDTLKDQAPMVKQFLTATRAGWEAYLKSPHQTNIQMQKLNPSMDLATFDEAAQIQKSFIETKETKVKGLGSMSEARFKRLYEQLIELKLVKAGMQASEFFR